MMRSSFYRFAMGLLPLFWLVLPSYGIEPGDRSVDFNRDIRPLLAKNCFACHGPDDKHREAGFRLDNRAAATQPADSGAVPIVPGKLQQSELVRRITSAEADTRMPPKGSGHVLTSQQIEVLKRWVAQGAPYAEHWSFVPPRRPRPPRPPLAQGGGDPAWTRGAIDCFVLPPLDAAGLRPSPEADRYALIRRLSLDLRGLPPTLGEVEAFLNDHNPAAYERLVDRFLADPAYGERWARMWLDLARYADSAGFGSDPLRTIWRYRDWVIDAFNANMPYDQFTIEQLAGDLLRPQSPAYQGGAKGGLDQRIATAFHRNTMTNTEGGTDDEEFRVAAILDRVDTTMQVWMGLTMGCAKCHSHKFDPIQQREYYQFFAIFNQTADTDQPNESPTLEAPTADQTAEIQQNRARVAGLRRQLDTPTPQLAAEQAKWEAELRTELTRELSAGTSARFVRIEVPGKAKLLSLAEVQVFSGGKNIARGGKATQSSVDFDGPPHLAIDGNTDGHYYNAKSTTHTAAQDDPWWEVDLGGEQAVERITVWNRTDNGLQSRLSNFRLLLLDKSRQPAWRQDVAKHPDPSASFSPAGGKLAALPADIQQLLRMAPEKRGAAERDKLAAYFRTVAPSLQPVRDEIARLEKVRPQMTTVPIMQELPANQRRVTHVLTLANFLNKGERVEAGLPKKFHPLPQGAPLNRLGLAQWLVDRRNPLTARVAVNRLWAQMFGVGLVETEEDFGTQGELPTHPELLDWLAVQFMESGWDQKALLRTIVTSATYRQSSRVTPEQLRRDPRNRLLSRGPRFRLEAEMVRDQALSLAGLLSRKSHGPSVYPPQPDGLWQAAFNGQRTWPTDKGENRYRRGLYTFWRRTVPYPSMATFDAPSREICSVRRIRTNTPLQSFVTLNDPVFVEAAQALARRIVREGGSTLEERAGFALRLCLIRPPQAKQVAHVAQLFRTELAHYRQDPTAAVTLSSDPLGPPSAGLEAAELAAWTVVANILLNMDGVLVKG